MVLGEGFVDERRVKEAEARNSELEARHPVARERAPDPAQGDRGGARAVHRSRRRSPRSASSSGCAESSTRKRRTSSTCATPSTRRIGKSWTTRTSSGSSNRARRDLEEASLGFERNLVAANERRRGARTGQPEVRRSARRRSRRGWMTRMRSCARRARRSTGSRSGWRRRTRAPAARASACAPTASRGWPRRRSPTAPRSPS